jgi:hypothetical protein
MGDHGEGGDDAEPEIGDESGRDQGAVEKIVKQLKKDEYRFQTMMLHIVLSDPFLKRRGEEKQ